MDKVFPGQTAALKKRVARKAVAAKVGAQLYSEVDLPHIRATLFNYRAPEDLPVSTVEILG